MRRRRARCTWPYYRDTRASGGQICGAATDASRARAASSRNSSRSFTPRDLVLRPLTPTTAILLFRRGRRQFGQAALPRPQVVERDFEHCRDRDEGRKIERLLTLLDSSHRGRIDADPRCERGPRHALVFSGRPHAPTDVLDDLSAKAGLLGCRIRRLHAVEFARGTTKARRGRRLSLAQSCGMRHHVRACALFVRPSHQNP